MEHDWNAVDLIQMIYDEKAEAALVEKKRRAGIASQAIEQFEEDLKIWFPAGWRNQWENRSDVKYTWYEQRTLHLALEMKFDWRFIHFYVCIPMINGNGVDLPYIRAILGTLNETFTLPIARNFQDYQWECPAAIHIDPHSFGEFLHKVWERNKEIKAKKEADEENERLTTLNRILRGARLCEHLKDLDAEMKEARVLVRSSEEMDRLDKVANAAIEDMKLKAKSEREAIAAQAELEAEQRRLDKQALDRFHPFVIYEVKYGAWTSDDVEFYTETTFVSRLQPDQQHRPFLEIDHGKITQVILPNVLRIARKEIRTIDDIPYGILDSEVLKSEKCGANAVAWIMPDFEDVEYL